MRPRWPSAGDLEQAGRLGTAELERMLAIGFTGLENCGAPRLAGTRSCGWSPFCLVATLALSLVPGVGDSRREPVFLFPSGLLPRVFSAPSPLMEGAQHQLQVGGSPCPGLKGTKPTCIPSDSHAL